jgi:hypothetical protein
MQEKAITYFVVAYLGAWTVDLAILCTSRPLMLDPILKLIIVLICLVIIMINLARNRWLL